ncbi:MULTISPECIES: cytochrome P450 [unclassified Frankia]|uniref:cytochrome P450 n=1 Tax=unclassified Frankia TaxID=2632575 RepID=UPI002AD1D810|nr:MULTISPECIES: cytochrome P450 [unclassified Frankia]
MTTVSPSHVEFDGFDPANRADPYPSYQRVREAAGLSPLFLHDVPVALVSRYDDCAAILGSQDWGHGHEDGLSPFWDQAASLPGSFIRMDPPDHRRLRRLVNKAFSARMVASLAPMIDELVGRLVDAALEAGEIDVIRDLSAPLAVTMVGGRLLGVPEQDRPALRNWELAIARGTDPDDLLSAHDVADRSKAGQEVVAYLHALIGQRRAHPTDDLLSMLVGVEEQGEVLTAAEVLGICVLLLVAGMETSINLIGNGMIALLRNPDQLALLRERPELTPAAVEEMLRYDTPTQFTMRVALTETTVAGHTFARGDGVIVLMASAGRDPAVFTDPDRFDITRYAAAPAPRRHLGFSLGLHYCLGAPLARMEAETAIRTLIARAPGLSLATDTLTYLPSLIHRGVTSLPLDLSAD